MVPLLACEEGALARRGGTVVRRWGGVLADAP